MKKTLTLCAVVAAILLIGAWFFVLPKLSIQKAETKTPILPSPVDVTVPTPAPATPRLPPGEGTYLDQIVQVANAGDTEEAWRKGFSAPIDFWGRVVNEAGAPLSEVKIYFSVNDNPDPYGERKKSESLTDRDGYFSLEGKQGASLVVSAVKDGWRVIKEHQGPYYFWAKGSPGYTIPTKDKPALIVMRKKGEAAELIRVDRRQHKLSNDGVPVEISLRQSAIVASGKGDIRVEYWAQDPKSSGKEPFDWRFRVSVPGGGLAPWKGEDGFEFEAPATGYKESEEGIISKATDRWPSQVHKKYFIKTGDGKYARIDFGIFVGHYDFFVVDGYYNPSGSRNLEFDEAKEIKVTQQGD